MLFERPEELLLVRGMTEEIYKQISDYVTIWGGGQVNVNTVSPQVLAALGMSPGLREKILAARRGRDGEEGTGDDCLFDYTNDNGMAFSQAVPLTKQEITEMNMWFQSGLLGVRAQYFRARSEARLAVATDGESQFSSEIKVIESVFQGKDGKIIYWREQ